MSFFSIIARLFKYVPDAAEVSSVERLAKAFEDFIHILETEVPAIEGKEELLAAAHDLTVHATEIIGGHLTGTPTETKT